MKGSKPKLLIVDDDPNMLELIEVLLTQDFEIHSAPDGLSGTFLACDIALDIILLDLGMPGIGGWDVLRALKESERTKDVPVVLFTANNTPAYRERAMECGCVGFIGKPLDEKELFETLEEITSTRM